MRIRFYGTGDSRGLPVFGSRHPVSEAARRDVTLRREQSCVLVSGSTDRLFLDAGRPDFDRLLEKNPARAVLLSHFRFDHAGGLLRLSRGAGASVTVASPADASGIAALIPAPGVVHFYPCEAFEPFELGEFIVTPLPLNHEGPALGYCVENSDCRLAYLCDSGGLTERSRMFLRGWKPDLAIIECSDPAGVANTPEDAVGVHRESGAGCSIFSHISEETEAWLEEHCDLLPHDTLIAADGMELDFARGRYDRRVTRTFTGLALGEALA